MGKKKNEKTVAPKTLKKPKQLKLAAEGMSRKAIAEIDRAAEAYREVRDERQVLTKKEKAAKSVLLDAAKKHGIDVYIYEAEDGQEFKVEYTAETAENVKVNTVKVDSDAGDDE